MQRLTCGHFLGRMAQRRKVGELLLTETRYAPGTELPPHAHEQAYICLVRRGTYSERFGRHTRFCKPQTLAIHPPDEVHAQSFHDAEVWSFNIEFPTMFLARVREATPLLDRPADFQGGALGTLAQHLYHEFRHADEYTALSVEGLVMQLLGQASRLERRDTGPRPPRWLAEVKDILHARYAEPLSLGQIGALVDLHPVYIANAFPRHCRCTVGQYLRQVRIEEASRRLASTPDSLAQIALAVGFADQSHFSRTFKRLTGHTPRAFRQMARRKME